MYGVLNNMKHRKTVNKDAETFRVLYTTTKRMNVLRFFKIALYSLVDNLELRPRIKCEIYRELDV